MKRPTLLRSCHRPRTTKCLLRLLDASASLWNELTYERRQNYFGDGDVWDTFEYRGRYNGVVGRDCSTGHAQEQRSVASFFALKEKGEYANPPSYWGNEEDGRELRTYIRCNQYTIEWGNVAVSKSLSGKN